MDTITNDASMAPNGAKIMNADVIPLPYYPSWSYMCSRPDWIKIRDILGGAEAMRMKRVEMKGACPTDPNSPNAAQNTARMVNPYLPRFALESDYDYNMRVAHAPFENHFFDALDAVCDKPFTKPVVLRGDDVPEPIKEFACDVDGQGTTQHEFAHGTFKEGAAFGIAGIFVDYPELPEGSTLADQRNMKARPYWIMVQAEDLLTFRKSSLHGRQYISELRFVQRREDDSGSIMRILRTVRIYRHDGVSAPTWETWLEQGDASWTMTGQGTLKGVTSIPFKEFFTGRRDIYTGKIISPMNALADLQITHFRQNTNLQRALDNAGFPMLCGNGIAPEIGPDGQPVPLQTGPGAVIYAPPMVGTTGKPPEWAYLEPKGDSIKALMENLDRIVAAIDKLGKAPLVKSTGRVTATSDAISAAKGHATAEVWAGLLAKAMSAAYDFTAQYLGITLAKPIEVEINTDFGIEDGNIADATEIRNWIMTGKLSTETGWEELQRRAVLSSAFDPKKERQRLQEDQARAMETQKAQMALQAAFAPPGKGGSGPGATGTPSVAISPPPGSRAGLPSEGDFIDSEGGGGSSLAAMN